MHIRSKKISKDFFGDSLIWLSRTCLPEILFVSILVLSRYQNNIDFSYPGEILLPIVIFSVFAAVSYYLYRFIFGRVTAGHLASLPLLYILLNFGKVTERIQPVAKALLPAKMETDFSVSLVLLILIAVVLGVAGFGLTKLFDRHPFRGFQIPKIALFLVAFVFMVQLVQVGARWVGIADELRYQYQPEQLQQDASKITAKPNVYYMVFDRYGNTNQLQANLGIDNSRLMDHLEQQGFVTRTDGYANYPFTMSSISSTLAMNYHTQLKQFGGDSFQTGFPYRSVLNDPPVAQQLRKNGYTYNQVGSWWDFTRLGIHADNNLTQAFKLDVFGAHFALTDLQRDLLDKSIAGTLLRKGVTVGDTAVIKYNLTLHPRQNFEWQMAALERVASTKSATPQFTFAHVLVPHDPYIFNADGSAPSYDADRNDDGADEKVKYANQVTYLNTRMMELVSYIRANDPSAAIVIQADEGPYPKQFRFPLTQDHYYNPKDLPLPEMKQKFSVLASYYMPNMDKAKVAQDINASVNPFRFILSNYLGYNAPMLPDCNFATGDKFVVYRYELMTEKLTGKPADSRCSQY